MEELNQIINVLENIEKNNLMNDKETKAWLLQLSSPEFGLITNCCELLSENLEKPELAKDIFLVIRKIHYYHPDQVIQQIKKSNDFIKGISKYINLTNPENATTEVFVILHDMAFNESMIKSDSNNKMNSIITLPESIIFDNELIKGIFKYIGVINSEETMNIIIKMISYIHFCQACYALELKTTPYDNKDIYNVFSDALNSIVSKSSSLSDPNNTYISKLALMNLLIKDSKFKLFMECSLRILVNNSFNNEDSLYVKILILDLMNFTKSSIFFTADIESIVDYSITRLESTNTEVVREVILCILEKITYYPGYDKTYHKKIPLIELLENHIDSEEIMDSQKLKCEKIIDYINGKKN